MKKYGLIGQSLKHSFSKDFFQDFFEKNNIEANYENIELDHIDNIKEIFESEQFEGFNVTIPYKEQVILYLDDLSDEALDIGAVNTIKKQGEKWIGYNTDAYGFQQSIKPFLTNKHHKAIVFGTGGASKAITHVLNKIGIEVIYVTRNPSKENCFSYHEVNEHMLKYCKLLINTTPVGMYPNINDFLPIPFHDLTEEHLVIDLIYNPEETLFLQKAKKEGAIVMNGLSMLKHQALKSWDIWSEK